MYPSESTFKRGYTSAQTPPAAVGQESYLPASWAASVYQPNPWYPRGFLYHGNHAPVFWSQNSTGFPRYPDQAFSCSSWAYPSAQSGTASWPEAYWPWASPSGLSALKPHEEDCPLLLAMTVAGIPTVPAPGVRMDRVLAAARYFVAKNPNLDSLWEEQLGGDKRASDRVPGNPRKRVSQEEDYSSAKRFKPSELLGCASGSD
nr:PREDICTED: uncharacterized protein LOC107078979 isoform X2 [Lepisosteus oculatus]